MLFSLTSYLIIFDQYNNNISTIEKLKVKREDEKKLVTNSHYKIKIKHKALDSGLNKRQAELKKLIDQHGTALKKVKRSTT